MTLHKFVDDCFTYVEYRFTFHCSSFRNARKETRVFGNDTTDSHDRSIVHIDIDCFYAQVEMVRNPELRSRPLGIQQKNIIVTSNYIARSFGIQKCMAVAEGLKLCPGLVLVRGEDLQHYRKTSSDIFSVLKSYGCPVEKLGMDENFIDVTSIVSSRLEEEPEQEPVGHVYGGEVVEGEEECQCGCAQRLAAATRVAAEMRAQLRERLCITSCAGVAHNKLLAKLATPLHKPDQQTMVPSMRAGLLLAELGSVRTIPGIGAKTAEALAALGLHTIPQLQACEPRLLRDTFSTDIAAKLKNLSLGVDRSEVKPSGKPGSVGLEDSFRVLSVESEVRDKFSVLLRRLLALVGTDQRRPGGLRVTLRHHTPNRTPARASRHVNLPPSLLRPVSPESQDKLLDLVMRLFRKMVDMTKPFHLTLIGLAFTKFQEVAAGRGSMTGYLMNDVSVQSVMNLENEAEWSPGSMECSTGGGTEGPAVDSGEGEVEPSPKKVRRAGVGCERGVGDLRLSRLRLSAPPQPSEVDPEVFGELPPEVQEELRASWSLTPRAAPRKDKPNTITRYFIPNKQ